MKDVFIIGDNIYSPLGSTTTENFEQVLAGRSGVEMHVDTALSREPFYASLFKPEDRLSGMGTGFTRFESLLIGSIEQALAGTTVSPQNADTILILSSTKGNISLLETAALTPSLRKQMSLSYSADQVAAHFHFVHKPLVVSNACISGLLGVLTGMRLIQSGRYRHAVVAGADVISQFVLSGFQSFQAVSGGPCKPFDAARNGINLGEGAGTVILSANDSYGVSSVRVTGGAVTNDANHISGPSRTGKELHDAICRSLAQAGLHPGDIDFINAHGTATVYNDEMESLAIDQSQLSSVPVNSLKGYYGHTLGAAGIIETIISARSMQASTTIPTKGYTTNGVTKPINVCSQRENRQMKHVLKTASGFGGCNAALVLSK